MSVANLTRYEDFPRFADDGRVVENYMPTYEGRWVKFEEAVEASSNSLQQLKAEIAACASRLDNVSGMLDSMVVDEVVIKLRQLSAV